MSGALAYSLLPEDNARIAGEIRSTICATALSMETSTWPPSE